MSFFLCNFVATITIIVTIATMYENILDITERGEFRCWLQANSETANECWLVVKRGRPTDDHSLWYLNAVEEALCFGWIDSQNKVVEGVLRQRFSPRRQRTVWTELNKERVRRLEKLGMMTEAGRRVLPEMRVSRFVIDEEIEQALRAARCWTVFCSFPPLYQRIRAYNVAFYKNRDRAVYEKALARLVSETKAGRMYGEWNDYGRLLD